MPDTKDLFDKISNNYDLLNSLFSAGIDKIWRKKLVRNFNNDSFILDVATGTAEVLVEGFTLSKINMGLGIDPSIEMLKIGRDKLLKKGLSNNTSLFKSAAENLPFKDNIFDGITIAFGIRNTKNYYLSLTEMHRVLRKDGTIAILEFAIPRISVFTSLYLFYFKNIMPFIGSLFGSRKEYKYLSESTTEFPQRDVFKNIMSECGFRDCQFNELSFGIAVIYTEVK